MPLTANAFYEFVTEDIEGYPVKASTTIFKNAIVGVDATGFARPFVVGDKIVGVALENTTTVGVSGTVNVEVRRRGCIKVPVSGQAITDNQGTKVYITDDSTFTKTSAGAQLFGTIRKVDGSKCLVDYSASALDLA